MYKSLLESHIKSFGSKLMMHQTFENALKVALAILNIASVWTKSIQKMMNFNLKEQHMMVSVSQA